MRTAAIKRGSSLGQLQNESAMYWNLAKYGMRRERWLDIL